MSTEQVKPGDLAVIVGGRCPENFGAVVRVGQRLSPREAHTYHCTRGVLGLFVPVGNSSFEVTTEGRPLVALPSGRAFRTRPYRAACLRPIRNPPGQDETLRWADVPRNDYADAGFMPLGD